jgi:hypothetical protein
MPLMRDARPRSADSKRWTTNPTDPLVPDQSSPHRRTCKQKSVIPFRTSASPFRSRKLRGFPPTHPTSFCYGPRCVRRSCRRERTGRMRAPQRMSRSTPPGSDGVRKCPKLSDLAQRSQLAAQLRLRPPNSRVGRLSRARERDARATCCETNPIEPNEIAAECARMHRDVSESALTSHIAADETNPLAPQAFLPAAPFAALQKQPMFPTMRDFPPGNAWGKNLMLC